MTEYSVAIQQIRNLILDDDLDLGISKPEADVVWLAVYNALGGVE